MCLRWISVPTLGRRRVCSRSSERRRAGVPGVWVCKLRCRFGFDRGTTAVAIYSVPGRKVLACVLEGTFLILLRRTLSWSINHGLYKLVATVLSVVGQLY